MTNLEPKAFSKEGIRNWPVTLTLGLTFLAYAFLTESFQ